MQPSLKYLFVASLFCLSDHISNGQVLIHSHNDYSGERPFYAAVEAAVFSIEADVFYRDSLLLVAHSADLVQKSSSLDKLYLEPLTRFCLDSRGRLGPRYLPVIMIDIKEDQEQVLPIIQNKLSAMQQRLSRQGVDTMPLFVISGNRPPADSFVNYPPYIQFDGRPYEQYDSTALTKIAFISDQYLKYSAWLGNTNMSVTDSATINKLVESVHAKGKKLRLWNTPDLPKAWMTFHQLGVDIINTDQPLKCHAYFMQSKPGSSN